LIDRKAGYVVGEVDTSNFGFISDLNSYPPRHEYLVIPNVRERIGAEITHVNVLAQVNKISNYSDILADSLSLEELESIISRYTATTKVYGTAKVLGYLNHKDEVIVPRSAAIPGQEVYIAPSKLLERFFTNNKRDGSGIPIGGLITREEVRVQINPNGFRKHVAVIAQTGAGKSYLIGLILENLLPLGATIIVFDPNSDYVMMKRTVNDIPSEIAEDMVIYRPPGIKGRRYSNEDIGGVDNYTIDFSKLNDSEICEVAGISTRWVHVRGAITDALKTLKGIYGPQQLVEKLTQTALNEMDRIKREAASRAANYIRRLITYRIWGSQNIPIEDLIKPKHMSIIDLAGLQSNVSQYIVQKTLEDVWRLAVTGGLQYPIFIILEEAHNFAPGAQAMMSSSSSEMIEKIAAEGRKFGIFLLVVTQRPNKISSNVLSQCNSQIIMRLTNPEDMSAVRRSSEGLSEDLFNDLPGLNKGEAVIVGELTKIPTMIKISGRVSGEGGSDIDLEDAFQRALEAYNREKKMEPEKVEVKEPKSRW
jgi:DNA helicase HerA-like ATPase